MRAYARCSSLLTLGGRWRGFPTPCVASRTHRTGLRYAFAACLHCGYVTIETLHERLWLNNGTLDMNTVWEPYMVIYRTLSGSTGSSSTPSRTGPTISSHLSSRCGFHRLITRWLADLAMLLFVLLNWWANGFPGRRILSSGLGASWPGSESPQRASDS
jgi:hypothetical protein